MVVHIGFTTEWVMVLSLIINFGEREVRNFDADLSRFQRDQKSLFERPKLLQITVITNVSDSRDFSKNKDT